MKKLIGLLALIVVCGGASATDLSVYHTHTYAAADTVAGATLRDTVYTPWMNAAEFRRFWFSYTINGKEGKKFTGYKDTAIALDSFAVFLQSAMYNVNLDATGRLPEWNPATITFQIGQCKPGSADLDTTVNITVSQSVDSTRVFGPWIRGMFIYADSCSSAAARPAIFENTYGQKLTLNVSPKK